MITEESKARAIALKSLGLSNAKITKQTGMSARSIQRANKEYKESDSEPRILARVDELKQKFSSQFESKVVDIVNSINQSDFDKANLQQKAVSAGILFDKIALIEGLQNQDQKISVEHNIVNKIREAQSTEIVVNPSKRIELTQD